MLAAKCGPQHIRAAQKVSRYDIDHSLNYSGSKTFVEKYHKVGADRLAKGERELIPPEQDKLLI